MAVYGMDVPVGELADIFLAAIDLPGTTTPVTTMPVVMETDTTAGSVAADTSPDISTQTTPVTTPNMGTTIMNYNIESTTPNMGTTIMNYNIESTTPNMGTTIMNYNIESTASEMEQTTAKTDLNHSNAISSRHAYGKSP